MGTTADKLNKIIETKEAIKQAISDKGVTINDNTPFADYPKKIKGIESHFEPDDRFNVITNNNTDYSYLFYNKTLTEIDLSNWNTTNVTNMSNMFYGSKNLTAINGLSDLDTSSVTNMNSMFYNCSKLTSLDVSNFDISNVTSMNSMFGQCKELTSLDLNNFNANNLTDAGYMFSSCSKLQELKINDYNLLYRICKGTSSLPTNTISGVTKTIYCKEYIGSNLTPPTSWVFSYTGTEEPTFKVCSCVSPSESINFTNNYSPLSSMVQIATNNGDGTYNIDIKTYNKPSLGSAKQLFYYCENLTSIDLSSLDSSNITSMENMFYYCYSLTDLNISNLNTSKVVNMYCMFRFCQSIVELDCSSFDTRNVTDMGEMFCYCPQLTTINMSNFDMTNVTKTTSMFGYSSKLHTLRLDNCNNTTIKKVITSSNFPTGTITGVTRTIYCKETNAAGLTAPNGWVFSYVD